MSEIRVVAKYDKHAGFDVRIGGLTEEQVDRFSVLLTQVTEERFPKRKPDPPENPSP